MPELFDNDNQPSAPAFRNRGLFSDHFLETVLKERQDTLFFAPDEMRQALADLRALWNREKDRLNEFQNESQMEDDWVKPVLKLLGFDDRMEVQVKVAAQDGAQWPDYVFFATPEDRRALPPNHADFTRRAIAVGDAKRWDRNLDQYSKDSRDAGSNKNPNWQIDSYLRATDTRWGILTNGRKWRLYNIETSYRLDSWYEVDLPALLERSDADAFDAFRYFYLFFRRAAFTGGADAFLEQVFRQSRDFAGDLGDRLKQNVFGALENAIAGFLNQPDNGLTSEDLPRMKEAALILLYRILFVLYAEARDLLPTSDPRYKRYSLKALKEEIEEQLKPGRHVSPSAAVYWERLRNLFNGIQRGDRWMSLPAYNGGLFDPQRHPDLGRWRMGDAWMAKVVDALARVGEGGDRVFVDYRTLSPRELGSVYEGILEMQPRLANRPMAQLNNKARAVVPADAPAAAKRSAVARRFEPGDVYLVNDKGERKGAGAYYTPDYIVKYIVEQTLGPLVKDRDADAILELNVLDPAMGSGHFLVAATDFLAGAIAAQQSGGGEVLDADALEIKRLVVERCIHGVDLQPLAVELAKVSLWLSAFSAGKPLGFLDHHLRRGNSLLGASPSDLKTPPGAREAVDADWDEGRFRGMAAAAVGHRNDMEAAASEQVGDVKEKEALNAAVRGMLHPWHDAADLWTAAHFDDALKAAYPPLLATLLGKDGGMAEEEATPLLARARAIARERHFLHWELEFPEVFLDEHGRRKDSPGFDAVIGNPPWVGQGGLGAAQSLLKAAFPAAQKASDPYAYFMELGNRKMREGGRFGFIVPNKFLRAAYGKPLCEFLASEVRLLELVDFGDLPVFEGATTYPLIIRTVREAPGDAPVRHAEIRALTEGNEWLAGAVEAAVVSVPRAAFENVPWSLAGAETAALLAKMEARSIPLKDWPGVEIYRGVLTGFNEAFVIDAATRHALIQEDPNSDEIIKPFLVGEDIKRYREPVPTRFLIFTRRGTDIDAYPAIKRHLEQRRVRLEPRPSDWKGDKWEGRKAGNYKWYEIQDTVDYFAAFEKPKIMWPVISARPNFGYDTNASNSNDKTFFFAADGTFLLAVLNSRLLDVFYRTRLSPLQGGFFEYRAQTLNLAPIPQIAFTTPEPQRQALAAQGLAMAEGGDAAALEAFAREQMAAGRADVIHDILAGLAQKMLDGNAARRDVICRWNEYLRDGMRLALSMPDVPARWEDLLAAMDRAAARPAWSAVQLSTYKAEAARFAADAATLDAHLAATDALVDRLVYRLYDLTDAEIAVVEG